MILLEKKVTFSISLQLWSSDDLGMDSWGVESWGTERGATESRVIESICSERRVSGSRRVINRMMENRGT